MRLLSTYTFIHLPPIHILCSLQKLNIACFIQILDVSLLSIFTPAEFSLLLNGVTNIDINDWKEHTEVNTHKMLLVQYTYVIFFIGFNDVRMFIRNKNISKATPWIFLKLTMMLGYNKGKYQTRTFFLNVISPFLA